MTHALLFHLISLVIISGGAIGSLVTFFSFRRALRSTPAQVPGVAAMFPRFAITAQVGVLLMILSGLFLMSSRGWADWGQTWLSIKLGLVLLLSLNGELVGKRIGQRMGQALMAGGTPPADNPVVVGAVRNLSRFYAVQIIGLMLIITLAVLGPR